MFAFLIIKNLQVDTFFKMAFYHLFFSDIQDTSILEYYAKHRFT